MIFFFLFCLSRSSQIFFSYFFFFWYFDIWFLSFLDFFSLLFNTFPTLNKISFFLLCSFLNNIFYFIRIDWEIFSFFFRRVILISSQVYRLTTRSNNFFYVQTAFTLRTFEFFFIFFSFKKLIPIRDKYVLTIQKLFYEWTVWKKI